MADTLALSWLARAPIFVNRNVCTADALDVEELAMLEQDQMLDLIGFEAEGTGRIGGMPLTTDWILAGRTEGSSG